MTKTTHNPSLRSLIEQATSSEHAADRFLEMANHLRRLDPTYTDQLVNAEVARLRQLAGEFLDDVEYRRAQALELYPTSQVVEALGAEVTRQRGN